MIFAAFFDESGVSPDHATALVMGGFIAHADIWDAASEAWDRCLRESPSIEYFSHHEANSCDGEFLRFSRPEAREKTKRLAQVIAQFGIRLQGVCATVAHEWFVDRDAKAAKGMVATRAYDWGFITVTSGVLQQMSKLKPKEYVVDFVFDEGRNELNDCITLYNEMKASGLVQTMSNAGICVPGDDKKIAALQMADLLAGEFSQHVENGPPATEVFNIIAAACPIIHLPCEPPPQVPDVLSIQKYGAELQRDAKAYIVRFYRDKERSAEMVLEAAELDKRKWFFYQEFYRLCALHGNKQTPEEFFAGLKHPDSLSDLWDKMDE